MEQAATVEQTPSPALPPATYRYLFRQKGEGPEVAEAPTLDDAQALWAFDAANVEDDELGGRTGLGILAGDPPTDVYVWPGAANSVSDESVKVAKAARKGVLDLALLPEGMDVEDLTIRILHDEPDPDPDQDETPPEAFDEEIEPGQDVVVSTESRDLPTEISDERGLELAKELSGVCRRINNLDKDKKASAKRYGDQIKTEEEKRDALIQTIESGVEQLTVMCRVERDHAAGRVRIIRTDTDQVIEDRPMNGGDRQRDLPLDAAENASNDTAMMTCEFCRATAPAGEDGAPPEGWDTHPGLGDENRGGWLACPDCLSKSVLDLLGVDAVVAAVKNWAEERGFDLAEAGTVIPSDLAPWLGGQEPTQDQINEALDRIAAKPKNPPEKTLKQAIKDWMRETGEKPKLDDGGQLIQPKPISLTEYFNGRTTTDEDVIWAVSELQADGDLSTEPEPETEEGAAGEDQG